MRNLSSKLLPKIPKSAAFFGFVSAILTGCSGGGEGGVMDEIILSWKGASISEVIEQWGYPDGERVIAGKKLFYWNENTQMALPATGTTTGNATVIGNQVFYSGTTNVLGGGITDWNCTRILEVDGSQKVIAGQWKGNNCPFMEAGPYAKWRRKS